MSDRDYYDPSPLFSLGKPLVLAGWVADDTRRIGFRLASLTGLPVADTDRAVEHRTGSSVWRLIRERGEVAYRLEEQRLLPALLADRPAGILTLGDGTLLSPENRRLVDEGATLVVLDVDAAGCYWRLRARSADSPAWHPLHPEPLERIAQVEAFWERRRPGLEKANHRVRLAGRPSSEVVEELRALLPQLAGG